MADAEKNLREVESLDIASRILDGLNVMIYVTVPETGEILFINETMKRHYGIKGGVGDTCYKVLQNGIHERCEFCPCHQLDKEPDKIIEWEEHSTLTKRIYRNTDRYIDWPDGRKVHIQHSVDITDKARMEETLKLRAEIVKAKNNATDVFCRHDGDTFGEVMATAIGPVADAILADCVCIYRLMGAEAGRVPKMIYRWDRAKGGTAPADEGLSIFADPGTDHKWLARLSEGEIINSRVRDMPEDEAALLRAFGINSLFVAPVFVLGVLWGMVVIDARSSETYYEDDSAEVELMLSAAHIFANAVIREEMLEKVQEALRDATHTLENMTSILNKSEMMIYAADPANDEVLFINDFTKRHYNIQEDVIGQPCYKVFNTGMDRRCDWCPCHQLDKDPDKIVIWEEHSTRTNRFYRNIDRYVDWFGDKKVHIQYRTDLTDLRQKQQAVERHQKLTEALSNTAMVFLSRREGSFKDMMTEGVEIIANITGIDTLTLWRNHRKPDGLHASQVFRWDRDLGGTTLFTGSLSDEAIHEKYEPAWDTLLSEETTINGPVSSLSVRASSARPIGHGVKSLFVAPIVISGALWGCAVMTDNRNERSFDDNEADLLRSTAFLFANAIIHSELEQSLSEAKERAKLMLDSTPLCCLLFNSDHIKIDCNEEAVRLFGFKDKLEFLERHSELYPEFQPDGQRSSEKVNVCLNKAFEEGSCSFDWTYTMLDGTAMPAEVILVKVKYGDGYAIAAYSRDLREVKAAQQKMLAGMERERDLEIQRKAAQAANDAKTQFLASMSHEIRTPMNAIVGMSDLLLSEELNTRQHGYVEDIRISGLALLDIINDILDLSKIQTAKLSLLPVHYNVKMLIEHISSMIAFLIKDQGKAIEFTVEIEDEFPEFLYGDDVRFRQVLLNLLSNAVKYTKEGGITLTVAADKPNMRITVADTGAGIPDEDLPTLFDAFEQADMWNNRHQQGAGLGLAITKSLAELMGGQVSVESVYGTGSSFHLVLPLVPGNAALIKHDNADAGIVYAPDAKVLVVDDRETNLNVACGLLRQCQINADRAISGAQAIDMVSKKTYDLIFMDHMMPEMDGIEATGLLRVMGVRTPIVALTANAITGARELSLSADMNDFLSKPIDKAELYRILRTWLPARKIAGQPDAPQDDAEAAPEDESEKTFWERVRTIKGLSVEIGLDIVSNQVSIYKNTLEISLRELDKSVESLRRYLADQDMQNFCTEIHGVKGSLALLGAMELSAKALKLEYASREGDAEFCRLNLPELLEELTALNGGLRDAFVELRKNQGTLTLPPGLPPILARITDAMDKKDFMALYDELDRLDELDLTGAVKNEAESLKEAALIMNFDYAAMVIERLLNDD